MPYRTLAQCIVPGDGNAVEQSGSSWITGQWLTKFQNSWFGSESSTEEIVRCSVDKAPVLTLLRGLEFVSRIYSVGMARSTEMFYLARSFDGMALMTCNGDDSWFLEKTGDIGLRLECL